jgi:peroxiredoxin Q/BCP
MKTGDYIPVFRLPDQLGNIFDMADIIGKRNLVIFFYPRDNTPGCTREVCSFRDHYDDFIKAGAEVIGISSDSTQSHFDFQKRYHLPFVLLSDPDKSVRKMFSVPDSLFGFLPGRVTYIIDKAGIIRYIFNSQFNSRRHVTKALRILSGFREN